MAMIHLDGTFDIRKYLDGGSSEPHPCAYTLLSENEEYRVLASFDTEKVHLIHWPEQHLTSADQDIRHVTKNNIPLGAFAAQKFLEHPEHIPRNWYDLKDEKEYTLPIFFDGTVFLHATEGKIVIALWKDRETDRWQLTKWKRLCARVRLGCKKRYHFPSAIAYFP